MNDLRLREMERFFLALSDKTRMQLVGLMADGEVSVGYLANALGQSQPKISRHLAYLRTMGVVSTRRDGKRVYYAVNNDISGPLTQILRETLAALYDSVPADLTHTKSSANGSVYDEELPGRDEEEPTENWQPEQMEVFLL